MTTRTNFNRKIIDSRRFEGEQMLLEDRKSDGIPKYFQLAKIISEKISHQEYKAGEQIPSEAELCKQYGVSRITVREAINKLVLENYLDRRQGRGTFVMHQKLRRNIAKVYSFSSDMKHLGLVPSSRLLALIVKEADPELAEKMHMPENNRRAVEIIRVRKANDTPILLETTLIPEYLCPTIVEKDLEKESLYKILTQEYQLMPHHAEETYEVIIMTKKDAQLLECRSRFMPAFAIKVFTYLENGILIEYTRSVGRGDKIALTISMVADRANFQRVVEF